MSLESALNELEKLFKQEIECLKLMREAIDALTVPLPSLSTGNTTSLPDSSQPSNPQEPPKLTPQEPPKTAAIDPSDYHTHDAYTITSTSLRDYMRSPQLYYHRYVVCDAPAVSNRAFSFGSAVHCLALEPEEFSLRFYVDPYRGGSTASRELADLNDGLIRLTKREHEEAQFLCNILAENPWGQANVYDPSLNPVFERDVSVQTPDGLTLKCKPDCLTESAIIDLKTFGRTQSDFADHARSLGYHIQAAFYAGVLALSGDQTQRDFVFWVICKSAPFSVFQYVLSYDQLVSIWDKEVRPALRKLRYSLENNDWAEATNSSEEVNLKI